MSGVHHFKMPPVISNEEGEERRVGFEIEFTGLDIITAADIIENLYGGQIKKRSGYEFEVLQTEFGDFKLELDATLIRDKKYEKFLRSVGVDISLDKMEDLEVLIKNAATPWIPFEIVTPPVRLSDMDNLNRMISELREKKAKGTKDSFLYAFGLHINPEVPSLSTSSVHDHLRSYVLTDLWIRKDAGIDLSRKITPYIDPFSNDYMEKILDPAYQPDQDRFIKDYFRYGNSRNRSLDLLPLFMYVNKDLTSELLEEELTSARPAYHYRLPNCEIDDPDWSLAKEWNRWLWVERLADDKKQLAVFSEEWLKLNDKFTIRKKAKWIRIIEEWVNENAY